MKELILHFKKMDWILILTVFFLTGIGLLSIYSSSKGDFLNFKKQLIFLVIGFVLMFLLSFFDWRILRDSPYLILVFYILCLISLLGLFFWAPEIRGVKSWYKLAHISIDPIEFTKVILIILLAKYFSIRYTEMYRVRHIFVSLFYVFLPAALIFFQPNLGAALILIILWIGILVISGIKRRHFLILVFCLILVFILSWNFLLKDYQKARIISFIAPHLSNPLKTGWSQHQAKIAIGAGGLFGQGFKQGSQTQYGFLPEPQTDFIFAAFAEEFGIIGVSILLILFFVLIWRMIRIAILSQTNFPRFFSCGLVILIVSEIFINIGMNLGLLPVIGIPLPLVSYGGSNLISIFIGLGILESIKAES